MVKHLRKIALIPCLAAVLSFAACDDTNDASDIDASLIVGSWRCTSATQNGVDNPNGKGYVWNFQPNGTIRLLDDIYTYNVSGNKITMSYEGLTPMSGVIEKLNNSEMSIEWRLMGMPAHNDYVRIGGSTGGSAPTTDLVGTEWGEVIEVAGRWFQFSIKFLDKSNVYLKMDDSEGNSFDETDKYFIDETINETSVMTYHHVLQESGVSANSVDMTGYVEGETNQIPLIVAGNHLVYDDYLFFKK